MTSIVEDARIQEQRSISPTVITSPPYKLYLPESNDHKESERSKEKEVSSAIITNQASFSFQNNSSSSTSNTKPQLSNPAKISKISHNPENKSSSSNLPSSNLSKSNLSKTTSQKLYKTSNSSLSNMSEYVPKNPISVKNGTSQEDVIIELQKVETMRIEPSSKNPSIATSQSKSVKPVKNDTIDRISQKSTHSEKVALSLRCCSKSSENKTENLSDNELPHTPAPAVLKLGAQPKHSNSLTVPSNNINNSLMTNSDDNNSSTPRTKEKKIGHRRVDNKTGLVTYKRQPHDLLGCAMQLGIVTTLSNNKNSNENRDILIEDFQRVEKLNFTEDGSDLMPPHKYGDFQFKIYAPNAFRYFRRLFGIKEEDFLASIGEPISSALISMSNPGASGSLFWRTHDDEFIIKTVQKDEAKFLRDLLPGYYSVFRNL